VSHLDYSDDRFLRGALFGFLKVGRLGSISYCLHICHYGIDCKNMDRKVAVERMP